VQNADIYPFGPTKLHGGGHVLGSKTRFPNPQYNPSGLVSRSGLNNDDIIYVGVNYRLGAFGWLSAQDIGDDGDANVGLLDQRLALQWIQKYIHNFGGDKYNVTVMGESAGAGSVLLHMLAYGNNTRPPFTRGILQSPFVQATATPLNDTFQNFLSLLNVSSLEQARKLEEKDLIAANMELIANAPTNSYMFGPTVDGSFFPEVPLKMLRQGNFDKSVDILSTHTSREGAYFFDPDVENEDQFRVWLSHSVAGLSQDAITYLASELYPPTYDGSHGYYSIEERQMSLWEEAYFDCLYVEVGDVMGGRSYAGMFPRCVPILLYETSNG
jgi:carboxylesterase type B